MFYAIVTTVTLALPPQQPGPLDSIARVAIVRNLGIRRATLAQREAEAGVTQARGLFMPTLGVDARYSELSGGVNIGDLINPAYATLNQLTGHNAFPTNIDATLPLGQETRLRATLPLFNGALFANLSGARAIHTLRGAERAAAVRRLDADVRIAYLDLARATSAVAILDETAPVIAENLRTAQRLVDAGTATPDAVLRSRAAQAEVRQQHADAVRLQGAALGALNLLLDQAPDAPVPALGDDNLPPVPALSLADALAASGRREEREMARAAVDGARARGSAAASAFLPSVALAADYGVQGNRYQFDKDHDVAIASVVLSWNLFNGGQDAGRRESASASLQAADLQAAEIDRRIALDVRTSWDAVQVAREVTAAAAARLDAARSAYSLVDRRFAEGLAAHLEWADARAQFTAARLNLVMTRFQLAARGVELERAAALRALTREEPR